LSTRSKTRGAVRGLRPCGTGPAPPCPSISTVDIDDAAGFTSCCGLVSCPAPLRTRPLDHARGLHYRGPWRLPGPDLHRLAVLSFSLGYVMSTSLSPWRPNCWTHSTRMSTPLVSSVVWLSETNRPELSRSALPRRPTCRAPYLDSSRTEPLDTMEQDGRNRPAWMRLVPTGCEWRRPGSVPTVRRGGFALRCKCVTPFVDVGREALDVSG